MLDLLGLPHLESQSTLVEDATLIIQTAHTLAAAECPHCHAVNPYKHGEQTQEFADAPIRGQPVRLRLNRQRYRCRACKKTFFAPMPGFSARRLMTRRLVHLIARDSLLKTFADVSREVGVDIQTVRGVFKDFSDWLRTHHPIRTPRVLGIDEAYRTGKYCTVLTDLERREYYDLFPTRELKPLGALIAAIPNKHLIEVVAMDLWHGYEQIVRTHLPQAVIVADKYHVVRMANKAMDAAHRATRNTLPTGERLALFRQRDLFSLRASRLSDKQQEKLQALLARFPLLAHTYQAKEAAFGVYDAADRQEARERLAAWHRHLPAPAVSYFKDLLTAFANRQEIILNYFEHRYTNAFTEAANGLSKLMQKQGRGYGFDVMRVKLIYGKRGRTLDLTEFDLNWGDERGSGECYGKTFYRATAFKTPASQTLRGPAFGKVAELADAGYYTTEGIATEFETFIKEFAADY